MAYRVRLSDDAQAEMARLSPHPKRDVNAVLDRLRSGPDRRLDLQLREASELWRAYAGRRWRVIFEVQSGRRIEIKRIRRRADAYRGIEHPHRRELREAEASYEAGGRVSERVGEAEGRDSHASWE